MATVDIIIPVYNTPAAYVRAALESVRAQTRTDWRTYVINDGSADDCSVQLEKLIDDLSDTRIVYIRENNLGLSAARNAGIRAGSSPLVALLDSDDLWHPDKLERQVPLMLSTPAAALSHACADTLIGDRILPARQRPWIAGLSEEDLFLRLLHNNIIAALTVMFRRAAVEQAGLFDEQFDCIEDKELWLRLLLRRHSFLYLDESLAVYRLHPVNLSKQTEKMRRGRLRLIQKLDSAAPDVPPEWTRVRWPKLRRMMLRHANAEAAETALDNGDYTRAIRYSLPNQGGISPRAGLIAVRSVYRMARKAAGV